MHAGSWLLDRYRLDRPIGAGGMGQVWLARDEVLQRDVAVKVLRTDPATEPATFERFVREARTAAALSHPNLVTVFDSGVDAGTAFLVMELLPGPTLTGYLAEVGWLPEAEAVALATQVASGLAAAHAAGVVHRDIKPANLVFDDRGQLKIVDFGIARLASAATLLTTANGVIGSPPYLSPEQLQGRSADERSDIYALGGVLMTMLTGRAPFEGTHPLALLEQHLHADPPHVRDRRPEVDPALDALVAQMLSKAPEDRPPSVRAVIDHLTGTGPALPVRARSGATAAAATARLDDTTVRRARRAVRSPASPGRWVVAGGAVLALVAAVIIAGIPTADTPTAGSAAPTRTIGATPTAAESSRTASPRTTPTATRSRAPEPSRSPSATKKSRKATRSAEPEVTDTRATTPQTTPRAADRALAGLRTAVTEVWDSGQIEAKRAVELSKRVDGLAKHLGRERGPDPARKVEDLDRYVSKLAAKGELAPAGRERIAGALAEVGAAVG